MRKHLTIEDIDKYMDTSDLSDSYLLWMEEISSHLMECEECQQRLQKAVIVDQFCEEENLKNVIKLAEQEAEIKRNILICKLIKKYQESKIGNTIQENRIPGVVQKKIEDVVMQLQGKMVQPFVVQPLAAPLTVTRNEDKEGGLLIKADGLEVVQKNTVVCIKKLNTDCSYTVVLDREKEDPVMMDAVWKEEYGWVVEIEKDVVGDFAQIYLLEQ